MAGHVQTQTEWEDGMALKILDFVRNELYLDLRFFDIALSKLVPKADRTLNTLATDGIYLKYSSAQILRVFQKNPLFLDRVCLHSVLHCIFSHLWLTGGRKRPHWDIACDIQVEYTIDRLDKPCTRRAVSWIRSRWYEKLESGKNAVSAAVLYHMLLPLSDEELSELGREFYTDDHRYWLKDGEPMSMAAVQACSDWNKTARQTRIQKDRRKGADSGGEQLLSAMLKAEKSRRSYRDFLQKFAVLHEEPHCDPDEFDLNFYIYGLALYKNLPLIEPLETRERTKIRTFVIVIDTSDSTSGELVRGFLRETFEILRQRQEFFENCSIHIIQCDDRVHTDEEVTDLNALEQMLERLVITGGGSTDFRPAFAYVNGLVEQGKLAGLNGLLYFTDGMGIYPEKMPEYRTAFLFLDDYDEDAVPPWAMRLKLEPEEFTKAEERT